MALIDIHTHHPAPQPTAVVALCLRPGESPAPLLPWQLYSAGIHPWDLDKEITEGMWEELERLCSLPQLVAVGECGIDIAKKEIPLFRQIQEFKRHVDLSESLAKPLVIHAVRADDIICGLHRDLKPSQPWIIHGYRGKPTGAAQLLKAGCYLSFGPIFNPDTVVSVPTGRILAETDDSPVSIEEVISALTRCRGEEMRTIIEDNTRKLITSQKQSI